MRLTNTLRDAFVLAAMADVPGIDYDEQIQNALTDGAVEAMPPKVREAYKAHPDWFLTNHEYVYSPSGSSLGCWPLLVSADRIPKTTRAEVQRLKELRFAQTEHRRALRGKLREVAYGCTTRKALAEALPEFEKYLPAGEAKTRNLPAVANVVAEFVQAGWPKSGAPA